MTTAPLKPLSYGILLFLLCYCVETLFTLGASGLIDLNAIDRAMYVTCAAKGAACLVAIGFIAARGRSELARAGFNLDRAARGSLQAIGAYLLFLPAYIFLIGPLNKLVVGDEQQAIVSDIMERPDLLESIPFLATVCVGVPILEEILFRGLLYQGLRYQLPVAASILLSGAVFGILHGLAAAIPIMTLGCLLAWLRERSSSIMPVVLVHILHNSWNILSIHILDTLESGDPASLLP